MAFLGNDGLGYELARKLESHGVWRTWLGDSLYASFVQHLASPSSWEAFLRADDSKSRAQILLQLRARALLFDKASVSLYLPLSSRNQNQSSSIPSPTLISKLNPISLQLHGDDVYFTLEQDGAQQQEGHGFVTSKTASSKIQSKAASGVGSRYGESDFDKMSQRFKFEELPETWYSQFFEKYRASRPYRLSEPDKRTPEQMSTYLRVLEKHKRRRVAFKEDQSMIVGCSVLENGSSIRSNSVLDENNAVDDDSMFFPEMMFPLNCVPDCALPPTNRVEENHKVEFNGVLDTLPQVMTRSPIMIERLGIRPEYLSMDQGGNRSCGKNGLEGNRKFLGEEQALKMSQMVIVRRLNNAGFEAASEVPLQVLSQLLSCHMCKLGRILKVLADSYRKHCSAVELLEMFLQTAGYSNVGPLAELLKDNSKNFSQQTQQQVQGIQSRLQSQNQATVRQPQQIPTQMHPQMQQMVQSPNLAFQQQQQLDRMRRRQQSTPRPVMNMNMDKDRPLVEVKIENPDFPMDNNAITANTVGTRHPQLQQLRQQQFAAISSLHAQSSNQFRPMASLQIPQVLTPNMGMARAPPVKVEGFQELMGGDATMKNDSEENKLTSPSK